MGGGRTKETMKKKKEEEEEKEGKKEERKEERKKERKKGKIFLISLLNNADIRQLLPFSRTTAINTLSYTEHLISPRKRELTRHEECDGSEEHEESQ